MLQLDAIAKKSAAKRASKALDAIEEGSEGTADRKSTPSEASPAPEASTAPEEATVPPSEDQVDHRPKDQQRPTGEFYSST